MSPPALRKMAKAAKKNQVSRQVLERVARKQIRETGEFKTQGFINEAGNNTGQISMTDLRIQTLMWT